jgi:ribosomal protein S18 acetylase RimI-like enzyme
MTDTSKSNIEYRVATKDDEAGISDVLVEVAPRIPARVEQPEDQETLKAFISEWVAEGCSRIAVDSEGVVIGFILSKSDNAIMALEKKNALYLPYIGTSENWQKRGVMKSLLDSVKLQRWPLTVDVLHANKSNMVKNLEKAGFIKQSEDPTKVRLRWHPPNAARTLKA